MKGQKPGTGWWGSPEKPLEVQTPLRVERSQRSGCLCMPVPWTQTLSQAKFLSPAPDKIVKKKKKRKEIKNCKTFKHVEAKQYDNKQSMDHSRNQRGNKKIPRDKWKLKHKIKTPWDTEKAVLGGKFINNTIISQETKKISNIHPNLTPKAIRERKINNTQI